MEEEAYLSVSKRGAPVALNLLQNSTIKGIEFNNNSLCKIINSIPLGSYPMRSTKLIIKSREWAHTEKACDFEVGFINLPILKDWIRYFKTKRKLNKELKKLIRSKSNNSEKTVLFVFDIYYPYLKIIKRLNAQNNNLHTCVMVTDLPNQYGYDSGAKGIRKKLIEKRGEKQLKLIKEADSYVLLTKQMSSLLRIENKPHVVVEAITNDNTKSLACQNNMEKIIMYTGQLNKEYGVDNLLQAFSFINDNCYQLWLFGSGDMTTEITVAAEKDHRIKYFGFQPKSVILEKQRYATVLINPRENKGEYVKYSFPSKIIEYMLSGVPMIGYRLDGVPEEYNKYIYIVEDNGVLALKKKIMEVCEIDRGERRLKANRARGFILANKNSKAQGKTIVNMLNKL